MLKPPNGGPVTVAASRARPPACPCGPCFPRFPRFDDAESMNQRYLHRRGIAIRHRTTAPPPRSYWKIPRGSSCPRIVNRSWLVAPSSLSVFTEPPKPIDVSFFSIFTRNTSKNKTKLIRCPPLRRQTQTIAFPRGDHLSGLNAHNCARRPIFGKCVPYKVDDRSFTADHQPVIGPIRAPKRAPNSHGWLLFKLNGQA